MERLPEVLKTISEIEEILVGSGIRDYCLACIKGPRGGCCQGCSLLSATGCTNKPLSCAAWLCSDAMSKFYPAYLKILKIANTHRGIIRHGARESSLNAELKLRILQ